MPFFPLASPFTTFLLGKSQALIKSRAVTGDTLVRQWVKSSYFEENPGEIWKRKNQWSFWSCAWAKLGQGNHFIMMMSSFLKVFSSKTQGQRYYIPRFEERFPFSWRISVDGRPNRRNKAVFSWRISVDGRPNRRNKAVFSWRISVDGRSNRRNKAPFSNFSGEVWTLPWLYFFFFLLTVTFLFLKLLGFFRQNQLLVT